MLNSMQQCYQQFLATNSKKGKSNKKNDHDTDGVEKQITQLQSSQQNFLKQMNKMQTALVKEIKKVSSRVDEVWQKIMKSN